ncbi:MAG: beta-propeller fold lactonase family protein [Terracidiphilus sp.]|nr:beta-propeller fold lactonase family protein [Terracidiphilus sp.]
MKFSKLSQLFLVSTLGLLVAVLLTACEIVTIDYVFVADSAGTSAGSAGQIQVFALDSASGALRKGGSTVSSGGTGPIAMALTSDYANLYVANQTSKNVVHFTIGSDGQLTSKDTLSLSDTPVALAVNPANSYLYVLTGITSATLSEYALSSGAIATSATAQKVLTLSSYSGDTIVPTALSIMANGAAVFATAFDKSAYNPGGTITSSAQPGWVFGYSIGSGGALTALSNSPYAAGVRPSGIAADPTNRFVYVTDYASSQLIGYSIQTNDSLTYMVNGPFKTGNEPTSIVVDPRGKFIYLANALDSDVSAYTITLATGTPSAIVNSNSSLLYATDTQPVSIAIEPALGRFVYTANHLGNSITGFRFDSDTGALTATQAAPYPTDAYPTALAIVPHGNHAVQSVVSY